MKLNLETIAARVRQEIDVRELQGYDVDGLADEWEKAKGERELLSALHDRLKSLPLRPGWPYDEPSDLDPIRQARPEAVTLPGFYLAEAEVRNKIHGAWLGRAVGCVLGKPLEMGLSRNDIQDYLQGADAYPLSDYVPAQSRSEVGPLRRGCVPSMQGHVRYAQEDDDLNYMCLAVKLLERYGAGFSTLAVGVNWLRSMPFLWTWGPEHVVYQNLVTALGDRGYGYEPELPQDIDLDQVASTFNPGTEWIGAQIRTDVYGYVCPHLPELAAEFAWRDAVLTHRKSGIYGAMWVAAMNAAAFTLLDMEAIIRVGLAQVPERSRFSEAILQTVEWYRVDDDWCKTGDRIRTHFDQYGFEGTINNACCVAAALLYGWGDGTLAPAEAFERTVTIAVQLGYDTDCNGATAGSLVGLVLGANALPEKWTAPLNDTLRTCVAEFGQVSISEMAERCYQLSRLIRSSQDAYWPRSV
jgi:ADP-ribosylglycohydrolase